MRKLVGIAIAIMLGIILIESYFLLVQPRQPVLDVGNPQGSISQPPSSSSSETPTEPPSATSDGTSNQEIPTPAVPEFTVALVDTSYDVPTTFSTDPYTGKTIIHEGHRVGRRTIEIRINNQPFTPYIGSYGQETKFYYNVRYTGHFTEDWYTVYKPHEMPTQSNSEYTVISYNSDRSFPYAFYLGATSSMLEVSVGGQVDFQVKALVGIPHEGSVVAGIPHTFTGKESDWSPTQTITIP